MKKLFGALVAMGAMVLMAVGVQAATYSAGVASPGAGIAEIPVMVTPEEGQTESVNGYVMTLTYDSTKVTPVVAGQDVTGADCYAEAGESFANGVLVSDVVKTEGNNVTLAVAWASADAVNVDAQAELANVDFKVAETATGDVPITVAVTALTNDGNSEADIDTITVGNGEITIDAEDFLRGDANGDGVVDGRDSALIEQSLVSLGSILDENKLRADANNDSTIDARDAALIVQSLVGLATIPD